MSEALVYQFHERPLQDIPLYPGRDFLVFEVQFGGLKSFLFRRAREAAEPGWKSRAGKRRR